MNKKLPMIFAAIPVLSGFYFGGVIPMSANSEIWSPVYANDDLAKYSKLIIHGTLTDSHSYVEWYISGNMVIPSVYTVWTIKHSETFKGVAGNMTEFVVDGGTYNNIVHDAMHKTELDNGDNVIVFLTKDADSIYKNRYYMVGIESGIYKIINGKAANSYVNVSYDVDSFKERLRTLN